MCDLYMRVCVCVRVSTERAAVCACIDRTRLSRHHLQKVRGGNTPAPSDQIQ